MRVGVDVGGTFTDVVRRGADGEIHVAKVPSTPNDQADGVLSGTERSGADPGALSRFVHGTTVATNTLLERTGARTVLVTTSGFRDVLEIGRQDRPSLYDQTSGRTPPVVPRDLVVGADERLAADGAVLRPLSGLDQLVDEVAALAPDSVAISLLFAFLDPRHEQTIAEAVRRRLDVPVTAASTLLPVFREYERSSTTVLNAYVAPVMDRYLTSLEGRLQAAGLTCPVEVMRSGGGTFTAGMAAREPVHTLLSGPAAGAWGAAAVGAASEVPDLIGLDMGGTSTDVTLIEDGRPVTTSEGMIDGLPFAVSTTDIHTVGSGGGSIAWIDEGGALRVGPRSSGADPGPACYGKGGTEPTVTDANVVLGHLDPEARLGGEMPLDRDAAERAVGALGDRLGLDVVAAAEGILRVVEAQMVQALRVVSVERGHDPRRFALLPFGGAGPLHQAALARALGCKEVIVPPHPGVLSALGLLAAPVTAEEVVTMLTPLDQLAPESLQNRWDELASRASETLRAQGADPARTVQAVELRYRGQAFELGIEDVPADREQLASAFHDAHQERYGFAQRDEAIELVNVRVRVEAEAPEAPVPTIRKGAGADTARDGTVDAVVDGRRGPVARYVRDRLGTGDTFEGPAVIVGLDTTVWLASGQTARVDEQNNLRLSVDEREVGP